jgi:catechol 2,3-dioxygenase-like lactoylglutathione lyase family enzyme
MAEDCYPMASFVRLSVADLPASVSWYQSVLGFRVVFTMPGPGGYRLTFVQQADAGLGLQDLVEKVRNASELRSR